MPPEPSFKQRTAQAAAEVLDLLRARWSHLRPAAREAVQAAMAAWQAELRQADSDIGRGNAVYKFLQALEGLPQADMLGEPIRQKARSGIVRAVVMVSAAEAAAFDDLLSGFADLPAEAPPTIEWAVVEPGAAAAATPKTPSAVFVAAPPPAYREPEATLAQAVARLQGQWHTLPPSVQAQVAVLLQQLVDALWYASTDAECTQAINRGLYALETIPATVALIGDLLHSDRGAPHRSGAMAPLAAAASLAQRIAYGPPHEAMIAPEPLASVAAGDSAPAAETFVDLHTKVDFPAEVSIFDEAVPLIVQLTIAPPEETAVAKDVRVGFTDLSKPELVTIVLTAEGFVEITGDPTRLIQVYATRDSQPAVFLLRPQVAGRQRLVLNFYHKDRLAGTASLTSEVKDRPPLQRQTRAAVAPLVEEAPPAPPGRERMPLGAVMAVPPATAPATTSVAAAVTLASNPPEPVDLELRVTTGSSKTQLSYLLHSAKGAVGYHWTPVGGVQLDDEPRAFLAKTFDRLSRMARRGAEGRSAEDEQAYRDELTTIGQNLYARLFSPELKREYRRIRRLVQQGVVKSVVITSDEPWIPWELVKPFEHDEDGAETVDDDFLCVQFRLSRWLAGRGIPDGVAVRAAHLVAPDSNLPHVARERTYFTQELARTGIQAGPILETGADVLRALEAAATQVFHFACHGDFVYDDPDESVLVLRGREEFAPSQVIGPVRAGVSKSKPLIFLNACHSGQVGFALTGLGGWAERFVNAGASAFIGTLWEVHDALAAEFAVEFYRRLWQGETLGDAFYAARLHIRALDAANPTWLAYTLYADPNARVRIAKP